MDLDYRWFPLLPNHTLVVLLPSPLKGYPPPPPGEDSRGWIGVLHPFVWIIHVPLTRAECVGLVICPLSHEFKCEGFHAAPGNMLFRHIVSDRFAESGIRLFRIVFYSYLCVPPTTGSSYRNHSSSISWVIKEMFVSYDEISQLTIIEQIFLKKPNINTTFC